MTPSASIKYRPNKSATKTRHGHPWVFADELVLDRRSKALPAGSVVTLLDPKSVPLGVAGFNANSKITIRMLDRDPNAQINEAWLVGKLTKAKTLREKIYDAPFYRLVHAEGDGLPGLIIDRFDDTVVIQPNAAWIDVLEPALVSALQSVLGVKHIYKNASGRARKLEGLDEASSWLLGGHSEPLPVKMNNAIYLADIMGGQKTGLFFDQRDNHAFAAKLADQADVLDVFSHVGGFALAALAAGARSAISVDGSAPALELAQKAAGENGFEERFSTIKSDAFDALQRLDDEGKVFDLVICDPPAFAPNKPARAAGLRAYERVARMASKLVKPGGYLVTCSCSHAADLSAFKAANIMGIGKEGRESKLIYTGFASADHPMHPSLAETGYLKAIAFQLD